MFTPVSHPFGKIMHHIFEYHLVNVLSKQIHEEPISHHGLLHDDFDAFGSDPSVSDLHQIGSHRSGKDDHYAIHYNEECQACQDEHPEPKKDVNLFVENVQGKNAQGVVFFNFTGSAEFVECTFGHPREDVDHGINSVFLITISEGEHLDTKSDESSIKEPIQEKHLA